MNDFFNSVGILRITWKWKWHILAITAIAGILSAVFSGPQFITPTFKSSAIVYPVNISPYSDESETEQMLQWIQSESIRDTIITRFGLYKHYEIDPDAKYARTLIHREYNNNVTISKTEYESVEITVLDKDPEMAFNIVNEIINQYNLLVKTIHKEKSAEVVDITYRQLSNKKRELDSVANELSSLRNKYELIDYASQAQEITRGYLRTIEGSNKQNINTPAVMQLKRSIEEKGSAFIINNTRLYQIINQFTNFQNEYEKALKEYQKDFTYASIVSAPRIADKKSFPVRWLIVISTIATSFFLGLVLVSILDMFKS
jgi:capsular polysaccharide biosynthesis protein